jgi:hypothetical protein
MGGQMEALVLRGVVTGITLAATVVSAVYVGAHVRNPTAPLRPPVIRGPSAQVQAPGGKLSLSPSVRSSDVQPVTSTYAS